MPPYVHITAQVVAGSDVVENLPEADRNKLFHLIEVADNGIGFEQKHAESIFKVFHMRHSKTEYSGTGIRLSITRKVVVNHGGYIWAESAPGEGARFKILLPAN